MSNLAVNTDYELIVQLATPHVKLANQSFSLIVNDLEKSFAYIHPERQNLLVFGHRYFEILFRVCVEFEILSKAVYQIIFDVDANRKSISDVLKILEFVVAPDHKVKFDGWEGNDEYLFKPLSNWQSSPHGLTWFRSYNEIKHNRHDNFQQSTLENCILSLGSLFFLLNILGGIKYQSFYSNQRFDGTEFPFLSAPFSIIASNEWKVPSFLDATPDAP